MTLAFPKTQAETVGRMNDLTFTSAVELVRLYRAPFFRLVQSEPDLGVRVLSILARRIRRVDRAVRG